MSVIFNVKAIVDLGKYTSSYWLQDDITKRCSEFKITEHKNLCGSHEPTEIEFKMPFPELDNINPDIFNVRFGEAFIRAYLPAGIILKSFNCEWVLSEQPITSPDEIITDIQQMKAELDTYFLTPEKMTKEQKQHDIDNQLVVQVIRGSETAFTELFQIHYRWVYSKAYILLQNHEDAEDAASLVFAKLWEKLLLKKWNSELGTFRSWFNILARNTIIDCAKKNARIADRDYVPLDNWGYYKHDYREIYNTHTYGNQLKDKRLNEAVEVLIRDEAQDILEIALGKLTKPKHRIAYILRHLEDYSCTEISRILQRKEGTVKIWIFRCKQELKQTLTEMGFDIHDIMK